MKAFFGIALALFCFPGMAMAEDIDLDGGISPNRSCEIKLRRGDRFEYVLIEGGRCVASVPSSYQPRYGAYALSCAKAPEIHWSGEGRYVAIDEENRHFSGDVLVFDLRSFDVVKVSDLGLAERIGKEIERMRVRVDGGWSDDRTLSLSIAGVEKFGAGKLERFTRKMRLVFSERRGVPVTPQLTR